MLAEIFAIIQLWRVFLLSPELIFFVLGTNTPSTLLVGNVLMDHFLPTIQPMTLQAMLLLFYLIIWVTCDKPVFFFMHAVLFFLPCFVIIHICELLFADVLYGLPCCNRPSD